MLRAGPGQRGPGISADISEGSFTPDWLLKPLSWAAGSKMMYASISQDGQRFGPRAALEVPCWVLLWPPPRALGLTHGSAAIPSCSTCRETRAGLQARFQCPKYGVPEPSSSSSSQWSSLWSRRGAGSSQSCASVTEFLLSQNQSLES